MAEFILFHSMNDEGLKAVSLVSPDQTIIISFLDDSHPELVWLAGHKTYQGISDIEEALKSISKL